MEKFSDTRNLLHYHGTGAFNMTRFENWDSFLMEMVACPKETVIVSCRRRGAGTGGWSKNNPYLKVSNSRATSCDHILDARNVNGLSHCIDFCFIPLDYLVILSPDTLSFVFIWTLLPYLLVFFLFANNSPKNGLTI